MASEYSVLPSNLNLAFVRGDEFGMLLDFDVDLSGGYTFTAPVYEVSKVSNGSITAGATPMSFTTTAVNLASGQINLSLQETQTATLDPAKSYRWYLRWVSPTLVTRTVLSGSVTIGDP
jgi:hypothetical protein